MPKAKTISPAWRIICVLAVVCVLVETLLLFLVVTGFGSYQQRLAENQGQCSAFCNAEQEPYFLFDIWTGGCQCYDLEEEPTAYVNIFGRDSPPEVQE